MQIYGVSGQPQQFGIHDAGASASGGRCHQLVLRHGRRRRHWRDVCCSQTDFHSSVLRITAATTHHYTHITADTNDGVNPPCAGVLTGCYTTTGGLGAQQKRNRNYGTMMMSVLTVIHPRPRAQCVGVVF
jgi:hypothetical protein